MRDANVGSSTMEVVVARWDKMTLSLSSRDWRPRAGSCEGDVLNIAIASKLKVRKRAELCHEHLHCW